MTNKQKLNCAILAFSCLQTEKQTENIFLVVKLTDGNKKYKMKN